MSLKQLRIKMNEIEINTQQDNILITKGVDYIPLEFENAFIYPVILYLEKNNIQKISVISPNSKV